mmetsp:Transcript_162095/g.519787  ORF Transcript_162095/g.519787 Transcript_162095/m.519787 type:complete len:235 (+) Transcript_162095:1252-1956(+)
MTFDLKFHANTWPGWLSIVASIHRNIRSCWCATSLKSPMRKRASASPASRSTARANRSRASSQQPSCNLCMPSAPSDCTLPSRAAAGSAKPQASKSSIKILLARCAKVSPSLGRGARDGSSDPGSNGWPVDDPEVSAASESTAKAATQSRGLHSPSAPSVVAAGRRFPIPPQAREMQRSWRRCPGRREHRPTRPRQQKALASAAEAITVWQPAAVQQPDSLVEVAASARLDPSG